ncbi:MAG: pseudouridine synthase [Spirochaetota bacterium]|mgnify:CR=1 FL=1
MNPGIRLQVILSRAGIGSRRSCEKLIAEGRVTVNGAVVTELGTRIRTTDIVSFDGKAIANEAMVYFAFHKPMNVMSTMAKLRGKRSIADYVDDMPYRIFYAGRLDFNSRGLMILTNDGAFAHRITHPSFEIIKEYRVTVKGLVRAEDFARARKGIIHEGVSYRFRGCEVLTADDERSVLRVLMNEGKRREIRIVCDALGHHVTDLVRVAIGTVVLGKLLPGAMRPLSDAEKASFQG